VNPCFPGSIKIPVTFATKPVAFCKAYELSIIEAELVTVFGIMAVEAPPHRFRMMEPEVGMFLFKFSLLAVYLRRGMATAARIYPLGERRRVDGKLLVNPKSKRDETNSHEKDDE